MKTKCQTKLLALILALLLLCSALASCVPTPDITTATTTTASTSTSDKADKPNTPPDPDHTHIEVIDKSVEPTCTSTGLTQGKHCSECGEVLIAQVVIAQLSHVYDDEYDAQCNSCGYTRRLNCTHSNTAKTSAKAPTCSTIGLTEGEICKDCGEILIAQNRIERLPHTYDSDDDDTCNVCFHVRMLGASEGLLYEPAEDGTCVVTGIGACKDNIIIIPEVYNGKIVSGIAYNAFYRNETITEVHMPDSIRTVGEYAFYYCRNLTKATISGNIGGCAFAETGLVSATLSDTVNYIGNSSFSWCASLLSINIPDSVTYISDSAFYACNYLGYTRYNNLLYLGNENNPYYALIDLAEGATYAELHSDTVLIAEYALASSSITEITIPGNVRYLGAYAFANSIYLDTVIIENGLEKIGSDAFSGCLSLKYINLPDSTTTIGYRAFADCSALTDIPMGNNIQHIEDEAFYGCDFTSVSLPSTLKSIGSYAFDNCSWLTTVKYEGTTAQWYNIGFGNYWFGDPEYDSADPSIKEIVCSDGVVKIK